MTIEELKNRLDNEKHLIDAYQEVVCGKKIDAPYILGIYKEDGMSYIYHTKEHGGVVIIDQGSEEEMTEALYRRVVRNEKRYLRKLSMKK